MTWTPLPTGMKTPAAPVLGTPTIRVPSLMATELTNVFKITST
jgi:hypothetical protein